MRKLIIMLAFTTTMMFGKDPELSDAQKVKVLQAQVQFLSIQAEKNALESRLKDLNAALPVAQQALSAVLADVAPEGYTVQQNLTLKAVPPTSK